MAHPPILDRLPLLTEWKNTTTVTGDSRMISGSAKAITPFGPLAGRTAIHVTDFGDDSAVISFMCGQTPVEVAVAGNNFHGLIRALIARAAADTRQALEAEFDAALEEGVA